MRVCRQLYTTYLIFSSDLPQYAYLVGRQQTFASTGRNRWEIQRPKLFWQNKQTSKHHRPWTAKEWNTELTRESGWKGYQEKLAPLLKKRKILYPGKNILSPSLLLKERSNSFLSIIYTEGAHNCGFIPHPPPQKLWFLQVGGRYHTATSKEEAAPVALSQWALLCALPSKERNSFKSSACVERRKALSQCKASKTVKPFVILACTVKEPYVNHGTSYESYCWSAVFSVQKIKLCKSRLLWMPYFNVKLNICFSQHYIYTIKNLVF